MCLSVSVYVLCVMCLCVCIYEKRNAYILTFEICSSFCL